MGQAIRQAQPGDRVKVNFNGTLEDGTLFDTTYEQHGCEDEGCGCEDETGPMEVEIGAGDFFPQVEEALIGMSAGEKKTITIKSDEAFGGYDSEQVSAVPRNQFPDDIDPQVGDNFELVNDDGEGMVVTVIDVDANEVTLDANHPLAGENLIFELELVEII